MLDLLGLQKKFILAHLGKGDVAVDFTMGNGYDTVFLSQTVGENGFVYAFDIQEKALLSTEKNLRSNSCPDNWMLIHASHDRASEFVRGKIKAGSRKRGPSGSAAPSIQWAKLLVLPSRSPKKPCRQ